ncbi:MAG: LytR/AlgR family response regulator transcription factor [Mangrovibacterium sp.]
MNNINANHSMAINEVNVAIIDGDKKAIKRLREEMESFRSPKLNVLFTTIDPATGIRKAKEAKPDILFLDIEMPGKNGIEILRELKDYSDFDCHVVFQTDFEKYNIDVLRDASFDFVVKPVERTDLSNMINRFMKLKYKNRLEDKRKKADTDKSLRISLPASDGLCLFCKNEIVYFEYINYEKGLKPFWQANTYDRRKIMLRRCIKGHSLLEQLNSPDFFMINAGTIVNLNYLRFVDYKNRTCTMIAPFENHKHVIARTRMPKFKERLDNTK